MLVLWLVMTCRLRLMALWSGWSFCRPGSWNTVSAENLRSSLLTDRTFTVIFET